MKLVYIPDMTRVLQLEEQNRPVKHVSFDVNGSNIAVSCTDGIVYIYSIGQEQPKMVKKLDGLIRKLNTDNQGSSAVIWHPDGRAIAAPMASRGQLARPPIVM